MGKIRTGKTSSSVCMEKPRGKHSAHISNPNSPPGYVLILDGGILGYPRQFGEDSYGVSPALGMSSSYSWDIEMDKSSQ